MTVYYEYELEYMYDEMLDECFGMVEVAGMKYDTSTVLKNVDEVAYRCGFNDWMDSEGWSETKDGKGYYNRNEEGEEEEDFSQYKREPEIFGGER